MNKTILFEGTRLFNHNGETIEDESFNEVELTEAECTTLADLIDNNTELLPLYELIELNANEGLKGKLMTCTYQGENYTFLPIKAYLEEA